MYKQDTVHGWRKDGHKVRVSHARFINGQGNVLAVITKENRKEYTNRIQARGGKTRVEVTDNEFKHTFVAEAKCSKEEGYNKRIGVAICLGRIRKMIFEHRLALKMMNGAVALDE